jgi:hypothetical protein
MSHLKRALGAMRVLSQRWSTELPEGDRRILRWLASEIIAGLAVGATQLAGESYRMPEDVFGRELNERLAEGRASYEAMKEIARETDKFLVRILREAGVDENHIVGAIGALAQHPPAYAEPLLELVQRLAAEPQLTRELPRGAEAYLAVELYGDALPAEEGDAACLLRLVASFVERQGRLPEALVAPLRWRRGPHGTNAPAGSVADANKDGTAENVSDETSEGGRLFDEAASAARPR